MVSWLQQGASEGGAPTVDYATNQDGGGSSQLYVQNLGQLISTGRQVNNHIGVYATGNGDPTDCNDRRPRGYLDSAGCDAVVGWAQDEDAPDAAIDVALGFDGLPGAAGVGTEQGPAGEHRDDLCAAIGSCNHGFRLLPPYSLFDGAPHAVHAVGLDADGARDLELGSSPRTMECATPPLKGVLRHVVNPDSYAAWGFVGFVDQLTLTDAQMASLKPSFDLLLAPKLVQVDGDPAVYLVDGAKADIRSHVPSPAVAAHWHLDLGKIVKITADELGALQLGPPMRDRPLLVRTATGDAIHLLDDNLYPLLPPVTMGWPNVGGAGGAGPGGAGGNGARGEKKAVERRSTEEQEMAKAAWRDTADRRMSDSRPVDLRWRFPWTRECAALPTGLQDGETRVRHHTAQGLLDHWPRRDAGVMPGDFFGIRAEVMGRHAREPFFARPGGTTSSDGSRDGPTNT